MSSPLWSGEYGNTAGLRKGCGRGGKQRSDPLVHPTAYYCILYYRFLELKHTGLIGRHRQDVEGESQSYRGVRDPSIRSSGNRQSSSDSKGLKGERYRSLRGSCHRAGRRWEEVELETQHQPARAGRWGESQTDSPGEPPVVRCRPPGFPPRPPPPSSSLVPL